MLRRMWFALASILLGSVGMGGLDEALARMEAGRLRLQLGEDLDRAEAHLETARFLVPENPRAHYLWGLLMEERGRRAEAIRSFEMAILYRPDYADARFRLAGDYFS